MDSILRRTAGRTKNGTSLSDFSASALQFTQIQSSSMENRGFEPDLCGAIAALYQLS